MNNKNPCILVFLLFVFFNPLNAQDHNEHEEVHDHEKLYPHTLALFVGYTFIPKSISSGEKQTLVVPTLGLDYIYKFNHKIGLSLQNDLELASYEVEIDDIETLNREYAFVSAIVFIYEPKNWWSVFAGPGFEIEQNENFFVTRIGTEFIKGFDDGWSLALTMAVDIKEVNTAPALGVTIFKGLGRPK